MKKFFRSVFAVSTLSMLMTSCSFLNPGPVPEDIIGDQPGELQAKINELLDQAGTDSTKVEFAEISSSFLYNPGDNTTW